MHVEKIKLGIAPIGWSNDDMPELGAHISFEQCITEMAQANFQGCEVGHKFPRDTTLLSEALRKQQLQIASAWFSLYFTEEGRLQETVNGFIQHMNFLQAMGAKVIVVCECGHSIQGKALSLFENKPNFTDLQWENLITGLHHIGKLAQQNNMTVVYHYHMGTGVQNPVEISRLMNDTDPSLVSLLLDTGHLMYAGGNSLDVLKNVGDRVQHVHLKDIRQDVLATVKKNRCSFLDSVKQGVFTVPGDGCIEFQPIFEALFKLNYQGWWIVEAEQDPQVANPLVYAKKARNFLRETVGF